MKLLIFFLLEITFPPDCYWTDKSGLIEYALCAYEYSSIMFFSYSNEIHDEDDILFEEKMFRRPNVHLDWNVLVESKSLSFILILLDKTSSQIILHWNVYFSSSLTKGFDICLYEFQEYTEAKRTKFVFLHATNQSLSMILAKTTCVRQYEQSYLKNYLKLIQSKLMASLTFYTHRRLA